LRGIFGAKTDIYAMYGLTEAFRSTYLDPALIDANPTSMGKAIPYAEIMVVQRMAARQSRTSMANWSMPDRWSRRAIGKTRSARRNAYKPAPAFSRYGGMAVWSGDTVWRDA
jgi:hypothetical protein